MHVKVSESSRASLAARVPGNESGGREEKTGALQRTRRGADLGVGVPLTPPRRSCSSLATQYEVWAVTIRSSCLTEPLCGPQINRAFKRLPLRNKPQRSCMPCSQEDNGDP